MLNLLHTTTASFRKLCELKETLLICMYNHNIFDCQKLHANTVWNLTNKNYNEMWNMRYTACGPALVCNIEEDVRRVCEILFKLYNHNLFSPEWPTAQPALEHGNSCVRGTSLEWDPREVVIDSLSTASQSFTEKHLNCATITGFIILKNLHKILFVRSLCFFKSQCSHCFSSCFSCK